MKLSLINKLIKYTIIGFITFVGVTFCFFPGITPSVAIQPSQKTQDEVLQWNALTLDIIRTEKTSPPMAARNLAMVHTAIYDAVNGISPKYGAYRVKLPAPKAASIEAAAIAAAHQILSQLYPKQSERLNTALTESLQTIATNPAKDQGIEFGKAVANQILTWRQNDGSTTEVKYTPIDQPGYWQPVPPDFKPASMPHWKNVQPFAMSKASGYRRGKPLQLSSAKYAEEFNTTKELGAKDSKIRTEDQTAIAKFWLDGAGTLTPPGHWNQIAADIATRQKKTLKENARLFALLNIALADASIIDSDHKYTFSRWRPITGILQADKDDNPQTTADPNWTPLLNTPSSPAYVSGHSTFGGAADVVLTKLFGDNINFQAIADPATNLSPRSFKSFTKAADEAGMSRVYGGAHWLSDSRDGLMAGRKLGNYVIQNFLRSL